MQLPLLPNDSWLEGKEHHLAAKFYWRDLMGPCDPMQFDGITRERFGRLQQSASQQLNVGLTGDSGTATDTTGAYTLSWNFDQSSSVLTLQMIKTPYPCFLVTPHLKAFIASCP
jgi:hypothetical protein